MRKMVANREKGEKWRGKEGNMGKSGVKGKNGENDVPTRKKGAPLKWGRAKKRGAKMYERGADLVGILSPPPFFQYPGNVPVFQWHHDTPAGVLGAQGPQGWYFFTQI